MITRTQVPEQQRLQHTARLFGQHFPLHFEPLVYAITDNIADNYHGGYWEFYSLSNGGFYIKELHLNYHLILPSFCVSCKPAIKNKKLKPLLHNRRSQSIKYTEAIY